MLLDGLLPLSLLTLGPVGFFVAFVSSAAALLGIEGLTVLSRNKTQLTKSLS